MFNKFMEKTKKKLNEKHQQFLKQTPFFNFINLFLESKLKKECFKNATKCLDILLPTYNTRSECFVVNNFSLKLKKKDISKIFGFSGNNFENTELFSTERNKLPLNCTTFLDKYVEKNEKMS